MGEDFVAKTNTTKGEMIFNGKPDLTEDDYQALGEHEFEHVDFNDKLARGDEKYEQFIKDANKITPFTGDLYMTHEEQEQAFIDGNFGILPDKRLEYPDEINSVVKEIETRKKLGLQCDILDEEEYEKAKKMVDDLHRKKRDVDEIIRKGRWDDDKIEGRYIVVKTKTNDSENKNWDKEAQESVDKGYFIETASLGEAIKAVDTGKYNFIFDRVTGNIIGNELKKRDIIIGKSTKPDSYFNREQLRIGTKVELEHTNSPDIAKRIAKDHLEESPRYYIELQKLEKRLKIP